MLLARLNLPNFFRGLRIAAIAWSFGAAVIVTAATAQQPSLDPGPYFAPHALPDMRSQGFINAAGQLFRASDLDMDGTVSRADARIQDEAWPRAIWRPVLEELLRYDLDFDAVVTREEIFSVVNQRVRRNAYVFPTGQNSEEYLRQRVENEVARLMRADRNNDGRIDWQEMVDFARQTPVPPNSVGGGYMSMILAMDEDGDGSVTLTEFDRAMERLFRLVDTDGNGVLSESEVETFRRRK